MVEVFCDGWWVVERVEAEGGWEVFLGASIQINVLVPTSSTE